MKARSASTGPSKRRTRSTEMPAAWATSSAEAPARIRAWMSRGRRWLSTSISIWPRRGRSPRMAARSRSSMGRVYSVLSAALSTSRVPSLLTATTRSSGTLTSRVVPADVTCVAAPVLSVACPLATGHNLAEFPGVSGLRPATPLWHGCLFATSSVDVAPGCPDRPRTWSDATIRDRCRRARLRHHSLSSCRLMGSRQVDLGSGFTNSTPFVASGGAARRSSLPRFTGISRAHDPNGRGSTDER